MHPLRNVVVVFQAILSFVLSRTIIDIYKNISRKHENDTVKDLQKYEKLMYKYNKLKLDIDFRNNGKQLAVYPKFLTFKLSNVSNKGASIRAELFRSAINKRNNELQHLSKERILSELFLLSKQIFTIELHILNKSIALQNTKLLQKLSYIQEKKIIFKTRSCSLPTFTAKRKASLQFYVG